MLLCWKWKMEAIFCSRLLSVCINSCLDTSHIIADTFLIFPYVHVTNSSGNTKHYVAGCTSEHSNCKIWINFDFFRYWLESTGFYFTWFAVPELDQYYIFQPRPTIYNVLLEMTKRMGYEVCLSSNLVSWFSFLSHFHASLHRLDLGFLGPWY
jgi:hypothetical protein